MRPGLVVIGIGLLVLAGTVVAAVFEAAEPTPGSSTHNLTLLLPGQENASAYVWGLNGSGVAVALSWHASAAVEVALSVPSGCGPDPGRCAPGRVLVQWGAPGTLAGAWSTDSSGGFPWLLRIVNPGPGAPSVTIQVTTTASRAPIPGSVGWAYDAFLIAGATLGGIGALSLFLGLFLKGGVYRPPPAGGASPSPPGGGPPVH